MLYFRHASRTISADREARVPHQDLARAAARFGTPVYVSAWPMWPPRPAGSRTCSARRGCGCTRSRPTTFRRSPRFCMAAAGCQRGLDRGMAARRGGRCGQRSVAFEGLGKTDAQLEFTVGEAAVGRPVRWLAIESAQEAAVLAGLAGVRAWASAGSPLDVLLRLNPEVEPETRPEFAVGARLSKFGMSQGEILRLVQSRSLAGPGLRLRGIHVHVGSDLSDVRAFGTRECARRSCSPACGSHVRGIALAGHHRFRRRIPLPCRRPGPEASATPWPGRSTGPGSSCRRGRRSSPAATWSARPAGWSPACCTPGRCVPGAAGRAGRRDDRVHPARSLRQQAPGAPAASVRPGGGVRAVPRWTRPAGHRARRTGLRVHRPFGRHPLPPLHRGDPVAIGQAGAYCASFTSRYNGRPPPSRRCYGPAVCCSDATALGPWSRPDARPDPPPLGDSHAPLTEGTPRDPLSTGRKRPRLTALCGTAVIVLGEPAGRVLLVRSQCPVEREVAIVPTQRAAPPTTSSRSSPGRSTPFNMQDFQWLMYRPLLWYGGQPGSEFGINKKVSLAYAPVYSKHDTVVTITMKKYYWSDGHPGYCQGREVLLQPSQSQQGLLGLYTPGDFPDNVKTFQAVNSADDPVHADQVVLPAVVQHRELSALVPSRSSSGTRRRPAERSATTTKHAAARSGSTSTSSARPASRLLRHQPALAGRGRTVAAQVLLDPRRHRDGPEQALLRIPQAEAHELIERPFTSTAAEFNALLAAPA